MKKNLFISIIIIAIVAIAGIISCDKINKPYRVEEQLVSCDTPAFPALNNVIQKYLLEDYTGHQCPNCPRAQRIATQMKTQMGDTLVLMAIHSGTQARPEASDGDCSYSTDYRTEVGDGYTEKFKIPSYPRGMINRMVFGNERTFSDPSWISNMASIPRVAPTIGIQIIPIEGNGEVCVFVKTTLLDSISVPVRLNVLLIESGMVSPQLDRTADSCGYVHNHVLRTAIAPVEGDNLSISAKDSFQIKGYSFELSGAWKKENCHIIAFIHDVNTDEILQVEEIALVE
ncbi:MAG: Omp28-related outer membrane protein [Bacteroidales bacterium]|nr:Omp28-related outer membrane protein [Bacteroidales bacterium]